MNTPTALPILHSLEAEKALLAAAMMSRGQILDLEPVARLNPSDFYLDGHQAVFTGIRELVASEVEPDELALHAHLEDAGTWPPVETLGGVGYLASLSLVMPPNLSPKQVERYAETIRDRSLRRRQSRELVRMLDRVGEGDAITMASHGRRFFERLEQEAGAVDSLTTEAKASRLLVDLRDRRCRHLAGEEVLGLPTGLPGLDKILGGLNQGLHLLSGPPGRGKTSLALQIALHVAGRGRPVLFASYENSSQSLLLKALCARAGLNTQHAMRGWADVELLEQAEVSLRPTFERLEFVDGDSSLTVGSLRARALRAMEIHGGPCLVVIDYLQLAAKIGRDYRELSESRARVDTLTGDLMTLCGRLASPVLALASQSRAGYALGADAKGGPKGSANLATFKESGDLEYSADVAMFLTGVDPEDRPRSLPSGSEALRLVVSKYRHGATGDVPVVFFKESGRFQELQME